MKGLSKNILLLMFLYFVQGLPYGLQSQFLPVYLRTKGLSLTSIGLLKLLYIPWVCKFMWGPLVDRYLTRRRWLLGSVLALGVVCLGAALAPLESLPPIAFILLLLNLFASVQDVAVDAIAIGLLASEELGLGNTAQVVGYKLGSIFAGGVLGSFVDATSGWSVQFLVLAFLYLEASLFVLVSPSLLQLEKEQLALQDDASISDDNADSCSEGEETEDCCEDTEILYGDNEEISDYNNDVATDNRISGANSAILHGCLMPESAPPNERIEGVSITAGILGEQQQHKAIDNCSAYNYCNVSDDAVEKNFDEFSSEIELGDDFCSEYSEYDDNVTSSHCFNNGDANVTCSECEADSDNCDECIENIMPLENTELPVAGVPRKKLHDAVDSQYDTDQKIEHCSCDENNPLSQSFTLRRRTVKSANLEGGMMSHNLNSNQQSFNDEKENLVVTEFNASTEAEQDCWKIHSNCAKERQRPKATKEKQRTGKEPPVTSTIKLVQSLLQVPGTKWMLGYLLICKLGETGALGMLPMVLLDRKISASDVTFWTGLVGQGLSVLGSIFAGWMLSTLRQMPLKFLLQQLSLLRLLPIGLQLLAVVLWNQAREKTAASILPEHVLFSISIGSMLLLLVLGGMMTTVVFTLMMQCSRSAEFHLQATHYTVLATAEIVGKLSFSCMCGYIADIVGYRAMFLLFAALSTLSLLSLRGCMEEFTLSSESDPPSTPSNDPSTPPFNGPPTTPSAGQTSDQGNRPAFSEKGGGVSKKRSTNNIAASAVSQTCKPASIGIVGGIPEGLSTNKNSLSAINQTFKITRSEKVGEASKKQLANVIAVSTANQASSPASNSSHTSHIRCNCANNLSAKYAQNSLSNTSSLENTASVIGKSDFSLVSNKILDSGVSAESGRNKYQVNASRITGISSTTASQVLSNPDEIKSGTSPSTDHAHKVSSHAHHLHGPTHPAAGPSYLLNQRTNEIQHMNCKCYRHKKGLVSSGVKNAASHLVNKKIF